MKVYRATEFDTSELRAHPYDSSAHATYYDFKEHPELITTVIKDFAQWNRFAGVHAFYDLLRWLNGPASLLESNDCAFKGPKKNKKNLNWQKRLECSGRLMLFYRDLRLNTIPSKIEFLVRTLTHHLNDTEPDLDYAVVGVSIDGAEYLELTGVRAGQELTLTFWAWGDSQRETMLNFESVVHAMQESLLQTSGLVGTELTQ